MSPEKKMLRVVKTIPVVPASPSDSSIWIAKMIHGARRAARNEALEEAAKVAETDNAAAGGVGSAPNVCSRIASAIRALAKETG